MIPSPGRVVHYRLNESDANQVAHLRQRIEIPLERTGDSSQTLSIQTRRGNHARAGDVLPMLIVKAWGSGDNLTETTSVNGQVFLDGNDTLWVTSRVQGDAEGQWFEPPRV